MREDEEDLTNYQVVVNHEEQYSIWPTNRDNPLGWKNRGPSGLKAECLAYIDEVWTGMRPLNVRKHMEEEARHQLKDLPSSAANTQPPNLDLLVSDLANGLHPIIVGLRPDPTRQAFKAAIDCGYVHIKFTTTQGGTELGVRLDTQSSNLNQADFTQETGAVHVEGMPTLNNVKVRCLADITLPTLSGTGHLQIQKED